MPKVSVLMPAYNSEAFVAEAIESILNQTYTDFEFIIINDGSTDKTAEIIDEYAKNDSRIKFINNHKNQGLIAVLNQGLDLCTGEYVARMDSDDISMPQRFEKQVQYMDEHQEVGILGTWIDFFPTTTMQGVGPTDTCWGAKILKRRKTPCKNCRPRSTNPRKKTPPFTRGV